MIRLCIKFKFRLSFNDIGNNKQDKWIFTNPLIKKGNKISIDLSRYPIGNIKETKGILNGDVLILRVIVYHNNAGTYFSDNGWNSYFNLSSATVTNTGLSIVPFATN